MFRCLLSLRIDIIKFEVAEKLFVGTRGYECLTESFSRNMAEEQAAPAKKGQEREKERGGLRAA